MILIQILRDFLGPFVVILDFTSTRTGWITLFFGGYLCMYGVARLQVLSIKKNTNKLIEESYKRWLVVYSNATDEELFQRFYPLWETELKKKRYFYVLNKHDLWPVSITPQHVLVKFPLSPAYIRQHLIKSGILETGEKKELPQKKKIGSTGRL